MAAHPQASLIQSECPITSLKKKRGANSMWKRTQRCVQHETLLKLLFFFFFPFSARLIFGYTSLSEIFIGQITVLNEQMGET